MIANQSKYAVFTVRTPVPWAFSNCMKAKFLLTALMLAVWAGVLAAFAGEITPEGQKLAESLDSMHVEQLWLVGRQVDWRTGEPNGKVYTNSTSHTHCSAFAAAAAEKLGVYLLHPPEHSAFLLANAQQAWLQAAGPTKAGMPSVRRSWRNNLPTKANSSW